MRRAARTLAGALALALLAIAALGASGAAAAATVPSGFQVEPAYTGLDQPVSFRFTPAGGLFVAEKTGKIEYFAPGASTPTLFADLRKPVYDNQDRGLLGLAIDPGFEAGRPYVYALYTFDHVLGKPPGVEYPRYGEAANEYENDPCPTSADGCEVSGRLVRLTAEAGHAAPAPAAPSEEVLIEGWCQQFLSHSIGDLAFGPEGALYVSGGDGGSYETADYGQLGGNPCGDPPNEGGSMRSLSILREDGPVLLNGALLRVDPNTGEGWPGNPFAASADANARRIVAFGFRNPFRFALDPVSGDAYIDNVGNAEVEEIDRFPFGATTAYDSGWPCFEGDHHNWAFEPIGLPICERLYNEDGSTSAPLFEYIHRQPVVPGDTCPSGRGSAISGVSIYDGSGYPAEYHRALFFADSVRGCIYVMATRPNGEPDPAKVSPFLSEQSSGSESLYPGVDIEPGPGGDLYYASLLTGTINRIKYDPETPRPALSVDKEWGKAPLQVRFDASGSTGAQGDRLRYEWDLDGNGTFEPASTEAVRTETYADGSKNVEVAVRVKDIDNGRSAVAHKKIYPGDEPPTARIEAPLDGGETWGVGQPLHFRGSATAFGGAALPETDLTWETRLLHCPLSADECHEHPLGVFRGTDSGQFPAPNHDFPSYVKFFLRATDSRGLSGEAATVKIAARPVSLDVGSSPPGISIGVGTTAETTPFQFLAIEGSPTTLSAPASAEVEGVEYRFDSWSDGGARSHVVPATSSGSYTAQYTAVAGPSSPGTDGSGSPGSSSPAAGPQPGPGPAPTIKRPKLDTRPAKQTSVRVARFAFATPGASGYRCQIDRRPTAPCHSPRTYHRLGLGPHTFRVSAVGVGGKPISAPTAYRWRVVAG